QRREGRGARDVSEPRAGLDRPGHIRNDAVRHAQQHEVAVAGHADASLAEPSGNGRPATARPNDVDTSEHFVSSSSVADTGQLKRTRALVLWRAPWVVVSSWGLSSPSHWPRPAPRTRRSR